MKFRKHAAILWRWLWLIILSTVIFGAAAFLVSTSQTPIYRATAVLLVSQGSTTPARSQPPVAGEQLARSYVQRLENYEVLAQAAANLELNASPETIARWVRVRRLNNTQLIALSVFHPVPATASALANEIPAVFAERNIAQQSARYAESTMNLEVELDEIETEMRQVEAALATERQQERPNRVLLEQRSNYLLQLEETRSLLLQSYETVRVAAASSLNTLVIDEPARPASRPIFPNTLLNTSLAAAAGLILAIITAFLGESLDKTVRSPRRLKQQSGLTLLGSVQQLRIKRATDALIVAMDPRTSTASAFRQMRTDIQYLSVDQPLRSILVTSADKGDGKSTVAVNLATALAQSGKQVILVDGNLRHPMLHKLLEVNGRYGLSNLIVRGHEDTSLLKGTLVPNLRLLPAGRIPPNPVALLDSERMKVVLTWLHAQADFVICDSPPLLSVADGFALGKLVDATLLVAGERTLLPAIVEVARQLQAANGRVAGVILNKVNPRRKHTHSYGHSEYLPLAEIENDGMQNGRQSVRHILQEALYSLNLFH